MRKDRIFGQTILMCWGISSLFFGGLCGILLVGLCMMGFNSSIVQNLLHLPWQILAIPKIRRTRADILQQSCLTLGPDLLETKVKVKQFVRSLNHAWYIFYCGVYQTLITLTNNGLLGLSYYSLCVLMISYFCRGKW